MQTDDNVQAWIDAAVAAGWKHDKTAKGHHRLTPPGGGPPILHSGTPSDHRGFLNFRARLKAAGIQVITDKKRAKSLARKAKKKSGGDLGRLNRRGPVSLATATRMLRKLRSAKSCRITPELLRVGMQVEREHRNVTDGGALKTAKIAAAHICERRDYYARLKRYVD